MRRRRPQNLTGGSPDSESGLRRLSIELRFGIEDEDENEDEGLVTVFPSPLFLDPQLQVFFLLSFGFEVHR
jgi:hypothetical protein